MRVASFVSSFCTLAHRCKPAAAVVANLVRQVDAEDQVLTSTAVVLPPTSGSISTISCLPVCGQVSSHVKMPTQACKKRRPPSDGHFSRLSQELVVQPASHLLLRESTLSLSVPLFGGLVCLGALCAVVPRRSGRTLFVIGSLARLSVRQAVLCCFPGDLFAMHF